MYSSFDYIRSGEYSISRKDRVGVSGSGGVCTMVRKTLRAKQIDILSDDSHTELLCFDVFSTSTPYRFFVSYRPHTSHVYDYVTCRDYMFHVVKWLEGHINTKVPTIVVGDFKCPDINWLNWSVPS